MKKKLLLIIFLMMVIFIPTNRLKDQKEEVILAKEVEKERVFEPTVFLNGGEFSGEITEDTLLHKGNYTISKNLIIKEGVIVEVEAGTTLRNENYLQHIIVNGTLKFNGTEEEKIKIDYAPSAAHSFLQVEELGRLEMTYTDMHNISIHDSYYIPEPAINNLGTAIIDHLNLTSKGARSNIQSSGDISIINSSLIYALIIKDSSKSLNIQNNIINGDFKVNLENANINTFKNIKNNISMNEKSKPILLLGNPTRNVILYKSNVYEIPTTVTIPENSILELEAGTLLKLSGKITVNGTLNLRGNLTDSVRLADSYEGTSKSSSWGGLLINTTGIVIASNTEFIRIGNGNNAYAIDNEGQLFMWNSTLDVASGNGIRYNTTNLNQILVNNFLKGSVSSVSIPINASYNYWGSEKGPWFKNPYTGSYEGGTYTVSDNIQFYPYNTTFIKNSENSLELIKTIVYDAPHFGKVGVNSFNGNYSTKHTDFEVSNGLSFTRTYNSKNTKESILGTGWSFSYDSYIEKHPYGDNSYIVHLPDSSVNVFMKQEENYISLNSRNTFEIVDEKYIITTKEQTIYTYNTNGKLESITDKYGNKTTLTYTNNLLTSITSNHRIYTLEYQNNLLSKITDPIGRTVRYSYSNGQLTKVTNTNSIETIYTYNDSKQLVGIKENNNVMLTLEYITEGIYKDYISKVTNEKGLITTYTYDSGSNMTTETDSNGRITKKYYDRDGYVYKEINPNGNTKTIAYQLENSANKYGEIAFVIDFNSAKTAYTRDDKGNIIKITNPDSSFKQYTYNSKNQVIKEIDEEGNITEYIYDTDGVTLLKQVKPLDGKTAYTEEADQNNFEIITYTYYDSKEVNNIKGLMKTKTDEKGLTTYTYNNYGDVISITNGNNEKTVYSKNKLGWVLTEQINDGYITEYEYDNNGNTTSIKKDSNLVSKVEYNYQNKPVKVFDGNCKEKTVFTPLTSGLNWNSNHNLLTNVESETICDAIIYEYDISGNKIKETDREGNTITYKYDQYGNVTEKISPNESSYLYEYDSLNRLIKTSFKDGENITLLEEKSYTIASTSTTTTKTYTNDTEFKTTVESYNNRNWKSIEKLETNQATINYYKNGQIYYTVDRNGGYTYYYYNKANRLSKKCIQADSYYICTLYTYDNSGRLIEEKLGKNKVSYNGTPSSYIVTTYQYNDIGQVIKKITSSGEEIEYTYDIYENVIQEKTKISEDKYQTKTYEYNYLNKVTKENLEGIITTYEYDGVGNIIKKTTGENVVTKYEYNKNYQVTKTILDNITQEEKMYDNMGNIIIKTDSNGNATNYIYDKRNNVIKETNARNLVIIYSYDYNNRLIETKDAKNNVIHYVYDKFDNVISKTTNDTITYQYTYDKNNNVLKEIDPLGNTTTYAYDKTNKVARVTDKLGNYKTYAYNVLLNVVTERNEKGIYIYYTYDDRGNCIEKKLGSTIIEQNEYDLMNNLVKKTDANKNVMTYEYNVLNQLIKKTNPLGYIEEYEYDKNGNLIKMKDYQKEILYSYDNRGNLLKTVEQTLDGKEKIETSKVYDNNNNVIKEIDGNGNITTYTYDGLNNVIKMKNPLNQETLYEYDNNNNLVKETNYLGDSKTYIYDSFDRLIEKKNELGETIEKLEYDFNGRQVKSIDGLGHTTTFVYDKLDRVIEKIDSLNRSEKTTYDALGNVLTKTDANGNITKYVYNDFNKVTKVTNALNESTIYTYDNNSNLLSVTDGNSKKIIYTYNALNLELTEKDALGFIETKEYNSNGILKKKTTKNGSEINYTYDIHNRLIKENDITYKYDNNDNLLEIKENENVITRAYDQLNRVTKKTENNLTTTFTYSDYSEKTVDPKGNETVKNYDKVGRLKEVVGEAVYTYNLDGTVKKVTYQNGSTEEYSYKDDKSLDTLVNTYHEKEETYRYSYDNNKNIISKYENGKETSYTYDALNRLKTISEVSYNEIENEELEKVETLLTTYLYDKAGNRTKEITSNITKEYTYDSNNRLTKIIEKEDNIITKTTIYTYDSNGNQLTETVNNEVKETSTYNERNELVKVVTDKETIYTYNPEGKRIQKQQDNKVIKFVYEGLDVILELDENDNELSHNTYGLALISRENSSKGYYLYNGHGDTVSIVNEENNLLNSYTYDEWGVIIESNGEFDNPYRYAGYYYDLETDNYYLLSRYYNPEIGRFISEDTYRGDYNDPLSLNRYVYVINNPLIYIDPDGYWPKWLDDFGNWIGKRGKAVGEAAYEFVVDTGKGTLDLLGTVSGYVISEAGKFTNGLAYDMGIITDYNYADAQKLYGNLHDVTSMKLAQMPENIITGIQQNFTTTFNYDNFINYLTTDNYNDIKNYSKSVIQTGVTLYGGYKTAKGINNLANVVSNVSITTKQIPIGSVINNNGTLSLTTATVPTITGINVATLNQAIINGSIGIASISTNGNYNKNKHPDPYKKFDLNNPESFRGAKLEDVENFMDEHLKDKTLGKGKHPFEKDVLGDGNGVRYYTKSGQNFELNYGYDKTIYGGGDGIHQGPYLKTTVGSKVVHIPLK